MNKGRSELGEAGWAGLSGGWVRKRSGTAGVGRGL